MAKKTKTPRTIIPIANKAASGKGNRLPKKEIHIGFWKRADKGRFHD